jgi:pimeloyl-ACP methyl ester carboxylesterase
MAPDEQEVRRREGEALVAELVSIRAGVLGSEPAYDLAAIRCPVATARGTASQPHHRRAAEDLARLVGDPASPAEIAGAEHRAHATHPAEFAAWVGSVVARVP